MKILFVSADSPVNRHIEKAFKQHDAEVFRFNERINTFLPSFLSQNKLAWSLLKRFSRLKGINNKRWNKRLISFCEKVKPDFLFTTKGVIIYPETLVKIKAMGTTLINWFYENVDHPNYNRWFLKAHHYYDHFFNYDPAITDKFGSGNLKYLPVAVNPDYYRVSDLSQKDKEFYSCDVCFVGALYPEREKLLSEVKKLGVNLKIFGWKDWFNTSLAENYCGPLLSTEKIAKAYSLSKISLNSNLQPQNGGVNLKTFEIPAAGGFQLSDSQPELKNILQPGKEVETYKTPGELLDKIMFYLSNEEKRKEIALAGYQRILQDHTINHRVKTILDTIKT
ncbi:MAG: glycosyltransferase [Patescibacteria group bacterium]